MRILNFGSLNIDHTYKMDHFVQAKETRAALDYQIGIGGKGLNQSVSLAKAGMPVYHAGKVGKDGDFLIDFLKENGVDTGYVEHSSMATGHAIIQVVKGQNSIIVYGGANQDIDTTMIDVVLNDFSSNDILLVQNEISNVDYLLRQAHKKGMKIICNPSPVNEELLKSHLSYVDIFVLNEVEIALLSDCNEDDEEVVLNKMAKKYPHAMIVLTKGEKGAWAYHNGMIVHEPAAKVEVVDTTCAGDTFTGFFISCLLRDMDLGTCLKKACLAASLSVTCAGAAQSIPGWDRVE